LSDRTTPALLAHPDREAALALPALEDLFRSVARQVRTRLVNRAGADIPVRLGVAQVTTVGHILEDSETRDGGVFSVFMFEPLGLPGLVVVQGRLLARIVGVMLGESPTEEAPPYRIRQVTELELRIARRACEDVMTGLIESWPASKPVKVKIESIGTNPRAGSGLAQNTPVVAASLDFGRPDDPYGLMIVAIPAQTTRDLRVPTLRTIKRAPRGTHVDLKSCMPLEVEIIAELAEFQLSFAEIQAIKLGNLLDLGPAQFVDLKINGHIALRGEPGESRGCHSVRICEQVGHPPILELVTNEKEEEEEVAPPPPQRSRRERRAPGEADDKTSEPESP
jgi:flagellar motor switch protein FliM